MTLCIVWRTSDNICFASDSRLTFGRNHCDAGIKVARVPFALHSVGFPGQPAPLHVSGDLGMTFAGHSSAALMTKDALSEIVRDLQGVPGHSRLDMVGIADLVFRGFEVISRSIGTAINTQLGVCIILAGYCATERRLRAYKMEAVGINYTLSEVIPNVGDFEIIGSGRAAALNLLPPIPNSGQFIQAMRNVISDPTVDGVGGALQYGHFTPSFQFQPWGVAELGVTEQGVHYWRGPLDLNGEIFSQDGSLISRFPYMDLI